MKYLYLPIDNRPCNNLFPAQLAQLQGIELIMPPEQIMDDFKRPSHYDGLRQWLFDQCGDGDCLILSIDNLVLGSLLGSRSDAVEESEALARLAALGELKAQRPGLCIHAFNVLMRTSISTFSKEQVNIWRLVNEYSQLLHKIDLYHAPQDQARLDEIIPQIPPQVLQVYLSSRSRNHAVNKQCIQYVSEGVLDSLSILQEDSAPFGVHKKEQKDLQAMIHTLKLEDRVFLHNGTDEAGCLTLARAFTQETQIKPVLSYLYLNDRRQDFIASYEDRPFHENLLSHSRTANIELHDYNDQPTDHVIVIYTPKTTQYEASLGGGTPPCDYSPEELDEFGLKTAVLMAQGKKVYFLDVAYANGGQGEILRAIHRHRDILDLEGYSAWNTASNSLGTLLAQFIFSIGASEESNRSFTVERLLDDYLYQGLVRKQLEAVLQGKGENTLQLADTAGADTALQALMKAAVTQEPLFSGKSLDFSATLPWPRIFEAKILLRSIQHGGNQS